MSPAAHVQSPARERAILLTLAAIQFTHVLDFMILMPLGSHLMRTFGASAAQFSILVAVYGLSAAIAGFAGGFVIDRFDRKHALLTLYFGFFLATFACGTAGSYAELLLARCAAGTFGGVAGSVIVAMIGDVFPPERRGRATAWVAAAFPMASIAGVPSGLALANSFNWNAAFFFVASLSALFLALALRVLPRFRSPHAPAHPVRQMAQILKNPIHRRGFWMSAALVFGGGVVVPFIAPSMVANVGIAENRLQYIYLAGGACTFLTTPWFGRLTDRHDKLGVLAWVTLAAAVAVLVLTHLPAASLGVAMLVTAVFMVAMAGRFTPAMAMLNNAVENRYRGGFMSVNSAVQQASGGFGNLAAGALVSTNAGGQLVGYPIAGFVAVACFVLTVIMAARLRAAAPHACRPGRTASVPLGAVE